MRAPGFDFMRTEPIFSLTFVASSLRGFGGWKMEDVHRANRFYFPRNYQDIIHRFDVIVLDNANRDALTDKQIDLLARGVREGGVGLFMAGGDESFGGITIHPGARHPLAAFSPPRTLSKPGSSQGG